MEAKTKSNKKVKNNIVKIVNNEVELLQLIEKSKGVSLFGSHTHGEISTEKIEGVKGVGMKINGKHVSLYLTSIPPVVKQPKAKEPKPPKVKPPKPPKVKKVKPPKQPKQPIARKVKTIKPPKQKHQCISLIR